MQLCNNVPLLISVNRMQLWLTGAGQLWQAIALIWFHVPTKSIWMDGCVRVIYGSNVMPLTLASRSFHCDGSCHIGVLMFVVYSLCDCRWSTSTWGFNYLYANLIPLLVVSLPHQLSTNDMCLTVCKFYCVEFVVLPGRLIVCSFVHEYIFRKCSSADGRVSLNKYLHTLTSPHV